MMKRVQSLLEDRFSFTSPNQQDSDLLLLINGCPRSCADEDSNRKKIPTRSVTGESDFENLIDWLTVLGEKGEINDTDRY